MKKAVIALGGNALGQGLGDGRDAMRQAAVGIADILEDGWAVLIVHGNGPQVGALLRAMELLEKSGENPGRATLSDCVAMSQGYIGNELQSALSQELLRRGLRREVATLLTRVEVDAEDTAFTDPRKPVGMHVGRATGAAPGARTGICHARRTVARLAQGSTVPQAAKDLRMWDHSALCG